MDDYSLYTICLCCVCAFFNTARNCNSLHNFILQLIMLQAEYCAKESNNSLILNEVRGYNVSETDRNQRANII